MSSGRWPTALKTAARPGRLVKPGAVKSRSRPYATTADLATLPKAGDELHGFTVQRTKHVPELELTAVHLQHDKTGAQYLHLARDDKNNVFSIGFKTNPPDATGVPHILEHTTLCGSKKYPVRDPFFKMLPRSLSNFMNAFTSSDHTTYPFATTNEQDFKNLLSVYLDATLHPLLKQTDFTQEGWRIGPENPEALVQAGKNAAEQDKKLVFKGVVYNEMKGQVSDASYLYYVKFQDQIFPAINNSGGDPQKMTDLTYEELKNFHAVHYHPSNAQIFTYGNMSLTGHLVEFDARLRSFKKISPDTDIKVPLKLEGRQVVTVSGPVDPLQDKDKQIKTSLAWIAGHTSDVVESFALDMISTLLIGGYGSPMYRALIESGLGTDWSPNTGYDSSGKVGIFALGLAGVKEQDMPKVSQAIHDTLRKVRETGFDRGKIDGQLQQLELALKHKTANFGMGIMNRLQGSWFNGTDPFDSLAWNKTVEEFKTRLSHGQYLEELVERYLLNSNVLEFSMMPAESYSEDIAAEERNRLAAKIAETIEEAGGEVQAVEHLTKQELALLEAQGEKQDLNCLPMVHVSDISRQMERKPIIESRIGAVKVQWRQAPTNGLTYFRGINEIHNLPDDLRVLIPLFNDAIKRIGTKDKTMEELEDLIKLKTGGVGSGYFSSVSPSDLAQVSEGFSFSGFALDRNVPAMFELLNVLLHETDFDSPRAEAMVRELIQSEAASALDSVASAGHAYARRYAEAGLSRYGAFSEQVGGLTHVKYVARLAVKSEEGGLKEIIEKLKTIQRNVISNTPNLRVALTCGAESAAQNEQALQTFLGSLPSTPANLPVSGADLATSLSAPWAQDSKTFFPLPYQVYYSCLALPTVPYQHADGAPLQVLSQLLTHKYLHHEIREKGGAYGGGAYSKGLSGVFGIYSYRDPNPLNTLRIMQTAGRHAIERDWTAQELEEAKLSVFQGVDAPESINEEGMTRFLHGVEEVMEQKKRDQILDVSIHEVRTVAQKYIADVETPAAAGGPSQTISPARRASRTVILGERRDWASEDEGWTVQSMKS